MRFRSFRQKPGFAVITLLISAVGIGATTVHVHADQQCPAQTSPFFGAGPDVILHGFREHLGEFWGFSYPDFKDIHHESRSLIVAAWTFTGGTISAPGEPEYVDGGKSPRTSFPF